MKVRCAHKAYLFDKMTSHGKPCQCLCGAASQTDGAAEGSQRCRSSHCSVQSPSTDASEICNIQITKMQVISL